MKTKALLTSVLILGSVQVADPISEISRYKTWSREVLTHSDLNLMQDHFKNKINEVIAVTADSSYERMSVDTLTASHSVTVGAVELSKSTHTHVDSHYTETEISGILRGGTDDLSTTGYAVFSHGHTAGTILTDNKTGTGKFVFHTSPVLAGTPKVTATPTQGAESGNEANYNIFYAADGVGMGAGSLLDADKLDGQEGSYYNTNGATGAVQFRGSNAQHSGSTDLLFTAATGSATSRLGIGIAPDTHRELSIGQPTGATTAGIEILMDTDAGENAAIEFAEDASIHMMMTYKGSATATSRRIIIGPDATNGNGLNINNTGEVGIETSPVTTADLTLGGKGLKFASDPGYDLVQTTAFNRWGGDPTNTGNEAKGLGNGTSSLTGNNTIASAASDADISQAFTRGSGMVAWDNAGDSDKGVFLMYTGTQGDLKFYHDVIPGQTGGQGVQLSVHQYGISVATEDQDADYELKVAGDGFFSGTVTENSDGRYKENAQSLTGALDKIKAVDAFSYEWKSDSPVGKIWADADSTVKVQSLGVSAQELKAVYPLLVKGTDETGYSVNYSRLTVVLLASIKELEARVAALEAE